MSEQRKRFELIYADTARGVRLDAFLAESLADISRSRAARLIRDGRVTVNGQSVQPARRLQAGDIVRGELPTVAAELAPEPGELARLLTTDGFVAVDKPAGIVMHPGAGAGSGTLAHRLVAHYPEIVGVGHPRRPGIVHRLDKDTSGAVLIARTPAIYAHLTQAFERREVGKQYLLIARGTPDPPRGRIDAPIGRHPTHRTRMAVARRGRPAVTDYRVLDRASGAALVEASPTTGRTHQIRVHMAAIGHPILGDASYGGSIASIQRVMLHAWTLRFEDDAGDRWLAAAKPPDDFQNAAADVGLTLPDTPASGLQAR
ncbi:MAG: RluA family pseudouridine synthase [Chloroflexi bacterium]|nr:RluA family pseudouridine synthase [Chloroflexota bacterium]